MSSFAQDSSRHRSPTYPSSSLDHAIAAVRKLYAKDRRAGTTRDIAASHLGYSGQNGAARQVLASMLQYELIEDAGPSKIRVSQLGEAIVLPKNQDELATLCNRAFRAPRIFAMFLDKYGSKGLPSDETLKNELMREHRFSEAAARDCIKSMRQGLHHTVAPQLSREAEPDNSEAAGDGSQDVPHASPSDSAGLSRVSVLQSIDAANERISVKLSANARAELLILGELGPREGRKLKQWLANVVNPWIDYMADEEVEQEDTQSRER